MIASILMMLAAAAPAPAPAKPAAATPVLPPVVCPAWGAKPAGCIEPPLRDRIAIYGSWNPELDREQVASGIIRTPVEYSRWDAVIPLTRFPAALRRGAAETSATVELLLTVAPDDSVSSCRPVSIKGREGSLRDSAGAQIALDPALGDAACAIAREHGKFRHAIDRTGQAVAAPLQLAVHFERQRYDRSLAPAPPPPSRWLGERPYDTRPGWPPRWSQGSMADPVSLAAPNWKDFLGGRKDLPKTATVGVTLDFDRMGQIGGCKVGSSSGDSGLDLATCQALMTLRNQAQQRWPLNGYPVEVRWKKDKATLVLPNVAVTPAMVAPLTLTDADVPGGSVPMDIIRLQVQLDPQGKPASCRIVWSREGNDAFDARSCALVLERAHFTGARDVFGRGAIGGLYLEANWQKRKIGMAGGYF